MPTAPDTITWQVDRTATRCAKCGGSGTRERRKKEGTTACVRCRACRGLGWHGIDPLLPTTARPGSEAKLAVILVRYASGCPIMVAGDKTIFGERGGPPKDCRIILSNRKEHV